MELDQPGAVGEAVEGREGGGQLLGGRQGGVGGLLGPAGPVAAPAGQVGGAGQQPGPEGLQLVVLRVPGALPLEQVQGVGRPPEFEPDRGEEQRDLAAALRVVLGGDQLGGQAVGAVDVPGAGQHPDGDPRQPVVAGGPQGGGQRPPALVPGLLAEPLAQLGDGRRGLEQEAAGGRVEQLPQPAQHRHRLLLPAGRRHEDVHRPPRLLDGLLGRAAQLLAKPGGGGLLVAKPLLTAAILLAGHDPGPYRP